MRLSRHWYHGTPRQWIQSQSLDPFVQQARRDGYIARSAFKLTHLDDQYGIFRKAGHRVIVDLGCSPGSWCQVIRERAGDDCLIIGVDLLPIKVQLPNTITLQGDFNSPALRKKIVEAVPPTRAAERNGLLDVVTSDMCPNRAGGIQDRQRIGQLNLAALHFAVPLLQDGGHFVCKVLGSRSVYEELWSAMQRCFLTVQICKPPASRLQSDESFLVGLDKLHQPRPPASRASGRIGEGGTRYGLDDWPGLSRHGKMHRRR